jgi:hypothetical protein
LVGYSQRPSTFKLRFTDQKPIRADIPVSQARIPVDNNAKGSTLSSAESDDDDEVAAVHHQAIVRSDESPSKKRVRVVTDSDDDDFVEVDASQGADTKCTHILSVFRTKKIHIGDSVFPIQLLFLLEFLQFHLILQLLR